MQLQESLQAKFPHLRVSKLLGTDSSETKRIYLEDINQTLEPVNVFIYSPVIESGVDITVKVEKVYGFICSRSNSPRAFLQMLARCRNVVDPNISILRDSSLKINKNFNFWKFDEVMELNRLTVENTKPELVINGDYLQCSENNRNARRKTVSIYNEVEKLNKNPSVFINFLRVLASGKGMGFNIIGNPEDKPKVSRAGSYKVSCTLEAEDIDAERYEELSLLRKAGKTTTEENYMIDKHFYQNHLLLKHLDKNILKEFMFNPSLLKNFTSLVDVKNHEEQDNLKSAKLLKQVELLSKLVEGLGFASPVDQQTVVSREEFMTNWVCNVVDDDAFKDHQQINQLFDLRKTHQISEGMESKQILAWVNALGKPFSIAVRAVDKHGGGYRLGGPE
jgi:hypothetical protein